MSFKKIIFYSNSIFFKKTEDGQDVFYPWGYPGEAIYINKKKKKECLFILGFGLLCALSSLFFFDDIFSTKYSWLAGDRLVTLSILPVYILGFFLINRDAPLYIKHKKYEDRSKGYYIYLFYLFIFAMSLEIPSTFLDFDKFSVAGKIITAVCILESIFIAHALFRLHKTRGYYFSKQHNY